jgi:hypothetical protein
LCYSSSTYSSLHIGTPSTHGTPSESQS